MRHSILVLACMTALAIASAAEAQTANGSPTAPAPGGSPGTPPPSSMTPPSGGTPGTAKPSAMGDQTPVEKKEQLKSDKDMTICKGC